MGLQLVELVLELEERFKVRISDEECERVTTVAEMAAVVSKQLKLDAQSRDVQQTLTEQQVLDLVRAIIAVEMRMPIDKVLPESRLVQDLGVN